MGKLVEGHGPVQEEQVKGLIGGFKKFLDSPEDMYGIACRPSLSEAILGARQQVVSMPGDSVLQHTS